MAQTSKYKPSFSKGIYGSFLYSQTFKQVVAGLIFDSKGQLCIAQRIENNEHKKQELHDKLEIPGGKINDGESHEEAIIRELKEELDIQCNVLQYYASSIFHYKYGSIILHCYFIATTQTKETFQANVHSKLLWKKPIDCLKMNLLPADKPIIEKLVQHATLEKYYNKI